MGSRVFARVLADHFTGRRFRWLEKMKFPHAGQALALALCLPLASLAQPSPASSAGTGSSPSLRYQSAFEGYRPYEDVKPGNWKALNDSIAESGGMSMAMPMDKEQSSSSGPAASTPSAKPMEHMEHMSGHSMPKDASSKGAAGKDGQVQAKPASKPSMRGMPGMSDHAGHSQVGAKP